MLSVDQSAARVVAEGEGFGGEGEGGGEGGRLRQARGLREERGGGERDRRRGERGRKAMEENMVAGLAVGLVGGLGW